MREEAELGAWGLTDPVPSLASASGGALLPPDSVAVLGVLALIPPMEAVTGHVASAAHGVPRRGGSVAAPCGPVVYLLPLLTGTPLFFLITTYSFVT